MKFGLLGRTLGHSFSPEIHGRIGDYDYALFEREPEALDAFFHEDWQGINVTIPYKEAVMPYCTRISEGAQRIGCVNTIVREADGSLSGYNTDYDGFAFALDNAHIEIANRKCLILGNGATSKTIATVLADKGAREILNIARHDAIPYSDIHLHHDAEVIVNATPVGMYPKTPARLIELDGFTKLEAVFDVIYNPHRTQFLLDAERLGVKSANGLAMLVAQAVVAAKYFIGIDDVAARIRPILRAMTKRDENIVLVGMPGAGKTTVGKALATELGRPFVDIDARIAADVGSVPDYIHTRGIDAFRALETAAIAGAGKEHGQVIATGGGAVTVAANKDLLRQNGRIYWINRPLEDLPTDGRPLSAGGLETVRRLYDERKGLYADFADVVLPPANLTQTVSKILEDFNEAMRD
ncbi:MAG: shikimate kinase [Peptococcaceae bacterium]|nr:shikimate kinase [Peptococcaceae bacterium]